MRRIKEVGGLTLAQDPIDAEYDSMPQSAIASGTVELVLPAAEMPRRLMAYLHKTEQAPLPDEEDEATDNQRELMQKILTQVRARSGYDFSRYKQSTLLRRMRRRMQLHGFDSLGHYLDFVRQHGDEARTLFADFLISVTNFFRDHEAFTVLEHEVIPALFQDKQREDQVRVWVAGCATGEEAYSIAMLLLEHAYQLTYPPSLQIFATDLNEAALRHAREGLSLIHI